MTVKKLEQEFVYKFNRAESNHFDKSLVKTAKWAWDSYYSYIRNLDALGLENNYNPRSYQKLLIKYQKLKKYL